MCLLTVDMEGCHVTPDRFRSRRSSDGCAGIPASFRYRKQHLETAVVGAWETDEIQKEEFDFNCVALMTKIKQNAVEQGNETYIQRWVDVKCPVQTVRATLVLLEVEIIVLVRQSVVVTISWAGRLKNRGWVTVRVEILSSAKSPDLLGVGGGDPTSYSVGIWGSFPTVYAAGTRNWPLISVWKWVEPYLHFASCFHIVDGDNNNVAVDFFFFSRRYIPWWVLACFTISFHNLSLHFSLQFLIFILFKSSSTWSSHLNLGLPTCLYEHGSHSVNFLTVLVVSILITCAAHPNLCDFVKLAVD